MKRFMFNKVRYSCKVLQYDEDPNLECIRISSNGIYNLYFWRRNNYEKPYAHKNNVKAFPDEVVEKAFNLLRGEEPDTVYINKSTNNLQYEMSIPTLSYSSQKMLKITDSNGNIALFTNSDDAIRYSIGKMVRIEEVNVTIDGGQVDSKEQIVEKRQEVKEEKKQEVIKEEKVEEVIGEKVEEITPPKSTQTKVSGMFKASEDVIDEVEPVMIKRRRKSKESSGNSGEVSSRRSRRVSRTDD